MQIHSFSLLFSNQGGWNARREEQKHRACSGKSLTSCSSVASVTPSQLTATLLLYILSQLDPIVSSLIVNAFTAQTIHLNNTLL